MKLSISNIAWPHHENGTYLKLVKELGCSGLEIAPSKIWPEPLDSTLDERRLFSASVGDNGLELSAMHALLYNRKDLGLFKEESVEYRTSEYLKGLCQLARDLGIKVLVFGSAPQRKREDIPIDEAFERAAQFFYVAAFASDAGVSLCIEPLGKKETDFINTAEEGLRLVRMVASDGFGLHLDAKALQEEGSDFNTIFKLAIPHTRHFHINEPGLIEVNSTGTIDHCAIGKALRETAYRFYASIEMKTLPDYHTAVVRSIEYVKKCYSGQQKTETIWR